MGTITAVPASGIATKSSSSHARGRAPRAGKIRLGIKVPYTIKSGPKKGQQGERPKELEYFKCPPEVEAEYGAEPIELKIALHSNEISEIIPYAFKWYKKGAGLVCKGHGDVA